MLVPYNVFFLLNTCYLLVISSRIFVLFDYLRRICEIFCILFEWFPLSSIIRRLPCWPCSQNRIIHQGWARLWCLTPLLFQLYCGCQFHCWRNPKYPEENHKPAASHWKTWPHIILSSTPRYERDSNSQL